MTIKNGNGFRYFCSAHTGYHKTGNTGFLLTRVSTVTHGSLNSVTTGCVWHTGSLMTLSHLHASSTVVYPNVTRSVWPMKNSPWGKRWLNWHSCGPGRGESGVASHAFDGWTHTTF